MRASWRREPDPADRRAVRLHLTAAGARQARRLLTSVAASGEDANRICRLCDPGVCGHPARCPVSQATGSR
jgi:hypothetical protein